jgi:hypothetical protein
LWERSDRIDRFDPGEGYRSIDRPDPLPQGERGLTDIAETSMLQFRKRRWVGVWLTTGCSNSENASGIPAETLKFETYSR